MKIQSALAATRADEGAARSGVAELEEETAAVAVEQGGEDDAEAGERGEQPAEGAPASLSAPTIAAVLAPVRAAAPSTSSDEPQRARSGGMSPLLPVLAAAAAAAGFWLFRRARVGSGGSAAAGGASKAGGKASSATRAGARKGRGGAASSASSAPAPPPPPPEPVDPDTFDILAAPAPEAAAAATAKPSGSLPLPLGGVRLVVGEDVDLAGAASSLGAPGAVVTQAAAASCPAVTKLQAAGAVLVGKSAVQPLAMDVLGANYGNPYNKAHVAGGGNTGAAAAIATGAAQLAVVTDALGSARVPAACCGLYCYRATPGALGQANAAAAAAAAGGQPEGWQESLAVMAADPNTLLKAAQTLGAPGSFNLRGEIVRFVVAEDLFAACAVEYQPAGLAIKRAILKWAGSEQAGAVQLCRFLAENSAGWQSLQPDALLADIGGLPPGLAAWASAARLLRSAGLRLALPELAAAEEEQAQQQEQQEQAVTKEAATGEEQPEEGTEGSSKVAGEDAESGAEKKEQPDGQAAKEAAAGGATAGGDEPQRPPRRQLLPAAPTPERLAAAREAATQLYDTLRHTVKPDTVIVLPVVPAAPPRRRTAVSTPEGAAFEALTHCFNSLASLAQCPVVVVPLGTVADGTPLAAALMGCAKFDARLLAVAAKMGPVMAEAFEGVKEGLAEAVRKQQEAEEAGPASAAAAASSSSGPASAASAPAAGSRGGAAATASGAASSSSSGGAAAAAAVDPRRVERAERFKGRGNELFKAGKFADALTEYSKAINEHPDNPVYYNNRAMACLKIFRFEQAEEDCNRALRFDLKEADKAKALLRRATARSALQKYPEAEKDLRAVLAVEPNNRQAREDLQHLQQMKADMAAAQQRMVQEFAAQRAMAPGAAAGAGAGAAGRGGAGAGAGAYDPAAELGLPPGLDFSQVAAAGGPEAFLQQMLQQQANGGMSR
ncbi:hypothetical protein HYH02_002233 [Chlamydomonas schloesseri]|uniref:Amidase domain-containing protein n=1 Tax=Chlamydomonas schloesseri TaxID=2026947 RepID=A0A836BBG5_9CHLO|nr:hypothetical protein HYH02_002233 [Chlamydomonas schloesseri]|eukprot:KAG2452889.1 hypothetical protein HYH02_002233 [Chlamydomonas schloesseri]